MKKCSRLFFGVCLVIGLAVGFSMTACGDGGGNGEYSFYGKMFNEASKNAVRERNRSARAAYVPDYTPDAMNELPNAIDANIVDLFALFELNDKWTHINKDKTTITEYQAEDNTFDDKDEYPWYVNHRDIWGEGQYGDKRKYWVSYYISTDKRVVEEFYIRSENNVYGESHPWLGWVAEDVRYEVGFTVAKHLDSKAFEISIGIRYADKGVQTGNITLEMVDDIILEF